MLELIPTVCVFEQSFENPKGIYLNIEKIIESDINFNWQWARTSGSKDTLQGAHRTNQEFPISSNMEQPQIKSVDETIFNNITNLIAEYSGKYETGPLTDEGYTILKYENGTHYKQHHDCGGLHKDRVVSILIYLNDDYVGGELEFPLFNVKYKPKAGDIILFPSNYTFSHIAHPVTEGTKYCVVSWMRYGE
jgi:predicted 2-oxoglutarate/Fe(II)-dependent dioxygenase YbiX